MVMLMRISTTYVLIQAARYQVRPPPQKKSQTTMRVTGILEVLFGSRLGERLYQVRTVDPEDPGDAFL